MDASLPVAQALAVKDGRIVEVGGTDEVLWLREDDYEVIDLAGRTVVPGFVDPHNHFSIGAFETLWADCRAARSVADLQQTLAAAASDTPAGAWVRGVVYDHHLIGAHPTRGDLDAAVPDRPALVMHFSHHQCVANSRALAEAGIARGTPDPPGGEIARDKSGEPTGLLFERALSRAETASREAWEARFTEVARAASRRYAALGITAIQDAAVTPAMARRYAEARAAGALAIEVDEVMVASRGWFERPDDAAPGALKIFVDGGYRCAMRVIRDGAPRTSGFLFYTREELAALLLAAWRAGRDATRSGHLAAAVRERGARGREPGILLGLPVRLECAARRHRRCRHAHEPAGTRCGAGGGDLRLRRARGVHAGRGARGAHRRGRRQPRTR